MKTALNHSEAQDSSTIKDNSTLAKPLDEVHQDIRLYHSPSAKSRTVFKRFLDFILPLDQSEEVTSNLFQKYGHIQKIRSAETEQLLTVSGVSPKIAEYIKTNRDLVTLCLEEQMVEQNVLSSPDAVKNFLREKIGWQDAEVFYCLFLDTQNKIITHKELFRGTLDRCAVFPREIVSNALFCGASNIILAHNHPSDSIEHSTEDLHLTKKLTQALQLVGIKMHDHFIVTKSEISSLREEGMIKIY